MHRVIEFICLKTTEAGIILIVLLVLFSSDTLTYWPDRPPGVAVIFAGSFWVLFWFYVLWGYFLTAAFAYVVSGAVSSWNPKAVAAVSVLAFVAHTLFLIDYLSVKMSVLSWLAWVFVVIFNAIASLLILQHGSRVVSGG
jgi:hypothetical protein